MSVTARGSKCSGQDSLPEATSCCPVSLLHRQQLGAGATSWSAVSGCGKLPHQAYRSTDSLANAPCPNLHLPSCQGPRQHASIHGREPHLPQVAQGGLVHAKGALLGGEG